MTGQTGISTERQRRAQQALAELAPRPSEHAVLSVQCPSSHHLAAVYETTAGLVVVTRPRRHAHGRRDLPDTPHHGDNGHHEWTDLLAAAPGVAGEDRIPAGCECGPWTLSRAELTSWVRAGDHRVVLEPASRGGPTPVG